MKTQPAVGDARELAASQRKIVCTSARICRPTIAAPMGHDDNSTATTDQRWLNQRVGDSRWICEGEGAGVARPLAVKYEEAVLPEGWSFGLTPVIHHDPKAFVHG
jgi:hypothetical protein